MAGNDAELHYLTIGEAAALIRDRKLSPVELTRAHLDRIGAVNGKLRSYVTLLEEEALASARVSEKEIQGGDYRGPLHGIPMAHKDLYDTAGVRTTGQSKVLEDRVPSEDATVIARLRGAGSVLLGKLAMFEFATGGPKTSLFDEARNPWGLDYATSGSSSGSGVAVAAGLCMGSLGSDTGGSVRGPAAFCGIVGLKPTYGRVSRYGVLPLSWSLDHCGPLTRTVEDTALMLQAIAGHDPKDASSSSVPVPDYAASLREDVRGLVIGVPRHYCFDSEADIDPETITAVEKALVELEGLGARVEEVTIPCLEYAPVANNVIILSEAFRYHLPNFRSQPQNYGEAFINRLYMGGLLTGSDYVQAQRVRGKIKREFARLMQKVDLIAMPTMTGAPVTVEEFKPTAIMLGPSFMAPFNQTGMPAISIPCGFNAKGLPLGLQLAGRPFDEATVLRAAHTYERHAGWFKRRPPV
jgi:aspartyl-tRNA(Asn)/glutamyl-tRNA(Gln) amidotransferase subunit A